MEVDATLTISSGVIIELVSMNEFETGSKIIPH